MKLFGSTTVTVLAVGLFGGGGVIAGEDMVIGFPGMLAVRATGVTSGTNMQVFTQALGGAAADPITSSGDSTRPFAVDGSTFTDFSTAATRSCNNQHNACAKIANSGSSSNGGLTVGDCDTQQTACLAAQSNVVVNTSLGPEATATATATETVQSSSAATSTTSANQTVKSADAEFFYICDV